MLCDSYDQFLTSHGFRVATLSNGVDAQRVLTVRGRVPTDRLRYTLSRLLSGLEDVDAINNQVEVISSTGLSTILPT